MNQEPLTKEKIGKGSFENEYLLLGYCDKLLILEDVKSAVNWLLKEIEKEERNREICAYNVSSYDEGGARFQSGFASGLRHAKFLIKKAFEGVVE